MAHLKVHDPTEPWHSRLHDISPVTYTNFAQVLASATVVDVPGGDTAPPRVKFTPADDTLEWMVRPRSRIRRNLVLDKRISYAGRSGAMASTMIRTVRSARRRE